MISTFLLPLSSSRSLRILVAAFLTLLVAAFLLTLLVLPCPRTLRCPLVVVENFNTPIAAFIFTLLVYPCRQPLKTLHDIMFELL